jgi:hypothetical protein
MDLSRLASITPARAQVANERGFDEIGSQILLSCRDLQPIRSPQFARSAKTPVLPECMDDPLCWIC